LRVYLLTGKITVMTARVATLSVARNVTGVASPRLAHVTAVARENARAK